MVIISAGNQKVEAATLIFVTRLLRKQRGYSGFIRYTKDVIRLLRMEKGCYAGFITHRVPKERKEFF